MLVRVRPDERFLREGDDLVTVASVPFPLRGPRRERGGPGRSTVAPPMEVPAGAQAGEVITLRGQGMPALRRGRQGDLRVVLDVITPRRLSGSQRELMQQLSDSLDGGEPSLGGVLDGQAAPCPSRSLRVSPMVGASPPR